MPPPQNEDELIASREWFHSIQIREGLVTPGRISFEHLQEVLQHLQFPASFEGETVLDVGAFDGFFSFEAERRGAKRVVACDLHPASHRGFDIARRLIGSNVEYVQANVYELTPAELGTFD
jgi:tRNA (mo5U34)-methyltransferase